MRKDNLNSELNGINVQLRDTIYTLLESFTELELIHLWNMCFEMNNDNELIFINTYLENMRFIGNYKKCSDFRNDHKYFCVNEKFKMLSSFNCIAESTSPFDYTKLMNELINSYYTFYIPKILDVNKSKQLIDLLDILKSFKKVAYTLKHDNVMTDDNEDIERWKKENNFKIKVPMCNNCKHSYYKDWEHYEGFTCQLIPSNLIADTSTCDKFEATEIRTVSNKD